MAVKKSVKILVSALIILMTVPWIIPAAQASSSTSQEYDLNYLGMNFHLNVIVQTESDGTWIANHEYQIHYSITITSIDESQINKQDYALFAYNPYLLIDGFTSVSLYHVVDTNSTIVWFGNAGTLTIKYTPMQEGTEQLQFHLGYQIIKYGVITNVWTPYETNAPSGAWTSPDPISINVQKENSASPIGGINPLIYVGVGIAAAVAVSVGTFFVYKSRKTKLPPPP